MCTVQKKGSIFFLTLTGEDEHRMNPNLLSSIRSALSQVRSQSSPGSILISSATGRFFSNGFDVAWAQSAGDSAAARGRLEEMVALLKPVVSEMMSLPMPTIAAVCGHASAAGFIFVLCHDYVLMKSGRNVMYMSELDIGLPIPDYFTAVLTAKIGSPAGRRDVMLAAGKLRAAEAKKLEIADGVYEREEETVEAAILLGEKLGSRKWDGEVYSEIRKSLYSNIFDALKLPESAIVASRM